MTESLNLESLVPESLDGQRLDQVAAQLFSDYSRSQLQQWIKSAELTVDGASARPRDKVSGGATLRLQAEIVAVARWQAQPLDLDIVHEDDSILVLDKPAGLVVHPAAGHADGTLLNALIHHCPALEALPRAGIVHRLDKETSGLMVVAKTLQAQNSLVKQLQRRTVSRHYQALVYGALTGGGTVNAPIGRHPRQRKKMAVVQQQGKEAITHYRLLQRFNHFSHIRCQLETGRTHQIRVHMAHIHHPLIGDPLYAGRLRLPAGASEALQLGLRAFRRQALHASELRLLHPQQQQECSWQSEPPADFMQMLSLLQQESDRAV